jgi:hypothetical protein
VTDTNCEVAVPVNLDFRDLFAALSAEDAQFLLVGGYAVMVYTEPRYTKDLDVWVRPSVENGRKVLAALARFGAPIFDLTLADLARPGVVFQMGMPPNRIDILTAVSGLDFESAWERRLETKFGDVPIGVLGLRDLLLNKELVGRDQDHLDARGLRAALEALDEK